ncbi:MAG: phosphoribosylaminoimidazolecarboxamide formyltransferase / cyclohydrolase [Chloroflexota bacterium]|jgi:phosphoribosylaminoimidazolecarboxamide formyltransferase/IMP cyclohydrolase|nr:phosphoribosylaminoimidazolecarboxamide formyltransferase / cyclohydrolase [Chloroflexota bacterium]
MAGGILGPIGAAPSRPSGEPRPAPDATAGPREEARVRALLSVANRDGIAAFARDLLAAGTEVFATDGTREFLAAEGVDVHPVTALTQGEPDVGGQVKTFHHAVYAGILARRDVPAQMEELRAQGIGLIDLVVVNVKPFAPAIGVKLVGLDEAIEMIDVAGAALLGAAARNAAGVAAVADPSHYKQVTAELRELGVVTAETRAKLAAEAFSTVAAYHAEIAAYLNQISGNTFPRHLALVLQKVDDLGYGENPHQRAAFYRETTHRSGTLADATRLQGEMPSFNNLLDLDAAYRIARDYTAPTVAIVKHTDPVGLASHDELVEAYRHALETDPVAAFGGIVGVNRELDGATAREIAANSYEAVVAPGFSQAAIGILRGKPGLELLAIPPDPTDGMRDYGIASLDFKRVAGGLLVESQDELGLDRGRLQVVTKRRPTLEELTDMLFAWRAVRHVRSNAVVLARNGATVGIGAGQASRQVSVEIAVRRAGDRAKLAVLASDAYFPFPDGIQAAAGAGVTAIIQPGGSIRDEMAIEVADRHHMAMVFTGRRHFRH